MISIRPHADDDPWAESTSDLRRALTAGCAYFAMIFLLGFALGTARILLAERQLGATGAVLVELPLMLATSWIACRWSLRRFAIPNGSLPRLAMGAIAFALLMEAEMLVSIGLIGLNLGEHLATYRTAPALLGLAAQVAFAAFPLVRRR